MAIDIGALAIDRASNAGGSFTVLDLGNPANADGIIDTLQVYATQNCVSTNTRIGLLYLVSDTTYKVRSSANVGQLLGGLNTFTNLSLVVKTNDVIGIYLAINDYIDRADTGGSSAYVSGEYIDVDDQATYTIGVRIYSLYGIGTTGAFELSVTDGIKVGDSRSESMVASLSRTDGLKSGDSTSELAMLARTDGLKVGDARSLLGYMSPSISDGLKVGDVPLSEMLASLMRTDGLKVGDTRLLSLLASLLITDSLKLGSFPELLASLSIADSVKLSDTPLSGMLTSLSRTDGITVGDIRNLVAMLERTDSLVIEKIIGGAGTKLNRGFN